MVRTADSALRVAGGKATRKGGSVSVRQDATVSRSPSTSALERGTGGLNPICPRETPTWQKPITQFFKQVDKPADKDVAEDNMMEAESINELDEPASSCDQEEQPNKSPKEQISADVDMEEAAGTSKKTQREASPEDTAPRKKIKLDKNIYKQLVYLENF